MIIFIDRETLSEEELMRELEEKDVRKDEGV